MEGPVRTTVRENVLPDTGAQIMWPPRPEPERNANHGHLRARARQSLRNLEGFELSRGVVRPARVDDARRPPFRASPIGLHVRLGPQRRAIGGEPREPFSELVPLTTVKRDEWAASEAEPVSAVLGEERNRSTCFLVDRWTDH